MILARYGDRGVTAGVVQRLVNVCRAVDPARFAEVPQLGEDGIYLWGTRRGVRALQGALGFARRGRDGIFGPNTWSAVATIAKARIVDVIDDGTQAFIKRFGVDALRERARKHYQKKFPNWPRQILERKVEQIVAQVLGEPAIMHGLYERLRALGGDAVLLDDFERPFDRVRRELAARSRDGWRVVLLRLYAHGSPGRMGIVGSYVKGTYITSDTLVIDDDDSMGDVLDAVVISGMTMPMSGWGGVELHGCNVAAPRRPARPRSGATGQVLISGAAYVQLFSNTIGRPVIATRSSNRLGTVSYDLRYEGPTVTAAPSGTDLRSWFDSHPVTM